MSKIEKTYRDLSKESRAGAMAIVSLIVCVVITVGCSVLGFAVAGLCRLSLYLYTDSSNAEWVGYLPAVFGVMSFLFYSQSLTSVNAVKSDFKSEAE